MKSIKKHLHWGIPTLGLATVFALVAWAGNPQQPVNQDHISRDTVPTQKRNKVTREAGDKDLDKELRQLENAKGKLEEIDWEKIQKSVDEALKNIDVDKIRLEVEKAMKQVDMEKINREVQESLKKIDFDKIQKEVNESLKNAYANVDKEAIKKEIEQARLEVEKELKNKDWQKEIEEAKKINKEEIEKEMEKAREEIKKARAELAKEKINMKKELKSAWVDIDKAKEELKGYQEMIYGLEKDGLLSTKEDYTIEYKKDDLYINGKKQPQDVVNKYKKYFRKDSVTIKKENGDIDIDHD